MNIVISGGGDLGYYLAKTMLARGHDVTMIEISHEQAVRVSGLLDNPVQCGDATDVSVLRRSKVNKADVFIAVTGRDEDNLIACQLAKRTFNVPKTIARSNNPDNAEVLKRLGVDFVLCDSTLLTTIIEQEADSAASYLVATLNDGKSGIYEFVITESSPVLDKLIVDIQLPRASLIISVVRGPDTIIPRGATQLLAGDRIVVLCSTDSVHAVEKVVRG